jgi:hypothetical protein
MLRLHLARTHAHTHTRTHTQVESMGGFLHPCHPLFRVVDWWSGGAYEAFLDRMLLGVMLVRDVLEASRCARRSSTRLQPGGGGGTARRRPPPPPPRPPPPPPPRPPPAPPPPRGAASAGAVGST